MAPETQGPKDGARALSVRPFWKAFQQLALCLQWSLQNVWRSWRHCMSTKGKAMLILRTQVITPARGRRDGTMSTLRWHHKCIVHHKHVLIASAACPYGCEAMLMFIGGVSAQRACSAQQLVRFPVAILKTPQHEGSIRPQGKNSRCRWQSGIFSVKCSFI